MVYKFFLIMLQKFLGMLYLGKLKYIYTSVVATTFILSQDTVYSIVTSDFFNVFLFLGGGSVIYITLLNKLERISYFYIQILWMNCIPFFLFFEISSLKIHFVYVCTFVNECVHTNQCPGVCLYASCHVKFRKSLRHVCTSKIWLFQDSFCKKNH